MVVSLDHGAAAAVSKSGVKTLSGSVTQSASSISANWPVIVWLNNDSGKYISEDLANVPDGKAFPRTIPDVSEIIHSISSTLLFPM